MIIWPVFLAWTAVKNQGHNKRINRTKCQFPALTLSDSFWTVPIQLCRKMLLLFDNVLSITEIYWKNASASEAPRQMPWVVAAGNVWCCLIPYLYNLKTKLNNHGVCGYYDMTAGFPHKTVIRYYFILIMLSFQCLQEPIRFSACDLSSTVFIVTGYYNSAALWFFFFPNGTIMEHVQAYEMVFHLQTGG